MVPRIDFDQLQRDHSVQLAKATADAEDRHRSLRAELNKARDELHDAQMRAATAERQTSVDIARAVAAAKSEMSAQHDRNVRELETSRVAALQSAAMENDKKVADIERARVDLVTAHADEVCCIATHPPPSLVLAPNCFLTAENNFFCFAFPLILTTDRSLTL